MFNHNVHKESTMNTKKKFVHSMLIIVYSVVI